MRARPLVRRSGRACSLRAWTIWARAQAARRCRTSTLRSDSMRPPGSEQSPAARTASIVYEPLAFMALEHRLANACGRVCVCRPVSDETTHAWGEMRAVRVPPGSGHTRGYVLECDAPQSIQSHSTRLHEHRFLVHASAAPYEERLHAAPEGTASHDERPAQQAHLPDRRVLQRQHKSF